jgi:xanthine/CO dehydrogenase XdhC/CoxF family maturation factor
VCPIGAPELRSKDPAVIAASTAVQLLIVSERLEAQAGNCTPAQGIAGDRKQRA